MKRPNTATLFSSAAMLVLIAACSSPSSSPANGPDAGGAGLGFAAPNVVVTAADFANVGDVLVNSVKSIQTANGGLLASDNSATYNYREVSQPSGPTLGVFFVKSYTIGSNAKITASGVDALVIIASDFIDIEGQLVAGASNSAPGIPGEGTSDTVGLGLGGGGAGTAVASAGGGGFCGVGGAGTVTIGQVATAATGGMMNGSPTLIPLLVGSGGGGGGVTSGGPGGGAVELVAANKITVGATGVIFVGGGGGSAAGVFSDTFSQTAAGGGSGGAILLAARMVSSTGTLAANGGGGGGGDDGNDATADAIAASGGPTSGSKSAGGSGSAGATLDGTAGTVIAASTPGGGGGGAGRIRVDTSSGAATLGGTVSPGMATTCVTLGTL